MLPQTAAIDLIQIYRLRIFLSVNAGYGISLEREDFKMIDLSEKSKEELFREKKEAELRAAKMKEGEWKRRKDKERKCMIGGTFLK